MDTYTANNLRRRIFIRGALATIGTSILNAVGSWLSLYSIFWWYDMPMHFFGGLFTALLIISFFLRYSWFKTISLLKTSILVLTITLLIGILWEGYEIIFAVINNNRHILLDSISDILFDIAGGIQAIFIYVRHIKIVNKNTLV